LIKCKEDFLKNLFRKEVMIVFSQKEKDLLSLYFYKKFSQEEKPFPNFRNFRNSGDYFRALLDWESKRYYYVKAKRIWCLVNKEEARMILSKIFEEKEKNRKPES